MSSDQVYKHCERVGHAVSVSQTEGQCRDLHNCSGDACPLEKEFGQDRFGRALGLLAANINQAWTGQRS
jgi:hypothetical protein